MKKIAVLLSLLVLSASAFALNAGVPADGKCTGKAAFEKYAAEQGNVSHIAQYILINLADPMQKLSNEEAMPLAVCYATYQVKGESMVSFVKANATIFPGDVSGKEATELRNFAARVEVLNEQDQINKLAKTMDNDYLLAQHILINVADPFAELTDEEAVPKAKAYMSLKVNGTSMVRFAENNADQYSEFEGLRVFANRVQELAK